MAKDTVTMAYAAADMSVSAGIATPTAVTISVANGAVVPGFFKSKDNSAYLVVTATAAGTVVLQAGNGYPIANVLGNLSIDVPVGTSYIEIENHGRFENKDGSLNIAFAGSIAGTIAAVAKRAGLAPCA